ncbi:MAG: DUF362 domain-containing protein [bacterium]|nr:DUF362 domain-containing protein [bacterium]
MTSQLLAVGAAASNSPRPRVLVRRGTQRYATTLAALRDFAPPASPTTRVLIKPNAGRCVAPGLGITTHPDVVAATCDYFRERGASLAIGEGTILGVTPTECFAATGMSRVALEREIPLLDFDALPARKTPVPHGVVLTHLMITSALDGFDCLVSVPVMKTHMHCGVSLGLKNLKGCLRGREKVRLHQLPPCAKVPSAKSLDLAIADMATVLRPQLVVVDGFTGMQGLGPSAGSQLHPHLVVVSDNVLAADAVAATLMGFDPQEIAHLLLAAQLGVGVIDLAQIEIDPPEWRRWTTPFARPPQKVSFEFKDVHLLDSESCSACLSTMLIFAQRYYAEVADYLPLSFAIGKGHVALPHQTFCVGNCTAKAAAGGHVFIKGCPPVASEILRAVRNQRKRSSAHNKKC